MSPISTGRPLVLLDPEGALDQVVVAPGAHDPPEGLDGAGRRDQPRAGGVVGPLPGVHRDRLLLGRVDQRVGEGDEVEEVIGVEVGEDHRVDLGVVDPLAELPEDAVAAVEQDLRLVGLDQVAAAGAAGVLPGRRLAEHGDFQGKQPHGPAGTVTGFGGSLAAARRRAMRRAWPGRASAARAAGAEPGPRECRAGRWDRASRGRGRRGRGAWKKQSSHVTAALRARLSAKFAPSPLSIYGGPSDLRRIFRPGH